MRIFFVVDSFVSTELHFNHFGFLLLSIVNLLILLFKFAFGKKKNIIQKSMVWKTLSISILEEFRMNFFFF